MKTGKFVFTAVISVFLIGIACTAADLAQLGYQPDYARSPVLDTKPVWRTVVLPPTFSGPTQITDAAGLQDYAGMALLRTGKFSLVDRSVIDQILEEQEFSYSGVVDPGTAVELGRLSGAEAVMTTSVTSIAHDPFWTDEPAQRDASLHIKVISVETSEVLYTATGHGTDFDGAPGALRSAMQMALMGISPQEEE